MNREDYQRVHKGKERFQVTPIIGRTFKKIVFKVIQQADTENSIVILERNTNNNLFHNSLMTEDARRVHTCGRASLINRQSVKNLSSTKL